MVSGGRFIFAIVGALAFRAATARAQSEYYNLDAGRATRVEDALPTERFALDIQLAGVRFERLGNGLQRWRSEPKLTYGLLPFTELEVRLPFMYTANPATSVTSKGFSGAAIGVMHAFNLETPHLPAFALSSEITLPSGSTFGAPSSAYSVKGIVTRTTRMARFHFNGAIGTYAVRPTTWADTAMCLQAPSQAKVCSSNHPTVYVIPPDLPCVRDGTKEPEEYGASGPIGPPPPPPGTDTTYEVTGRSTRARGQHWLLGVGLDRPFALHSLLLSGDVYAERFNGLLPGVDWTAEIGARHQISPRLVLDLGVMRKFSGTILSSGGSVGLSYELPTRRR